MSRRDYVVRIVVERDIQADNLADAEAIAREFAEQINVEIGGSISWAVEPPAVEVQR